MLKHFIECLHPGVIFSETSIIEIPERDVKKVNLSASCYAFRFFDKTVTMIDGEILTGDRKNISGWYYKGEIMSFEQVKSEFGNDIEYRNIISNMEINGIKTVVRTKFGQLMPLNENDTVL